MKDTLGFPDSALVRSIRVIRVDPERDGWTVQSVAVGDDQSETFSVRTLANASGLSANLILNFSSPAEKKGVVSGICRDPVSTYPTCRTSR